MHTRFRAIFLQVACFSFRLESFQLILCVNLNPARFFFFFNKEVSGSKAGFLGFFYYGCPQREKRKKRKQKTKHGADAALRRLSNEPLTAPRGPVRLI